MEPVQIAIIGGSGLYDMPELSDIHEYASDAVWDAERHRSHRDTGRPARRVSAAARARPCPDAERSPVPRQHLRAQDAGRDAGHQRERVRIAQRRPRAGPLVVPDQLFDFTKDERGRTFFGHGLVSARRRGEPVLPGTERPAGRGRGGRRAAPFTRADADHHRGAALQHASRKRPVSRSWGFSIIGMTTSPEAYLAREAEIGYAVMAHVTDYDVWHESEADVTAEMVLQTFQENISQAQQACSVRSSVWRAARPTATVITRWSRR